MSPSHSPALSRTWGLSPAEWATTAVAALVSSAGYLAGGLPYLSRGVVGDLAGFALLAAVGTAVRARVRHEAAVCLLLIGAVLLASPQWPLEVAEPVWWGVFAVGLVGYLAVRRRLCAPRLASEAVTAVLPADVWQARQAAHEQRVDAWTAPVLARRSRGEAHPVEDFLFTYYGHRPAHLRRWSPGAGVVLQDGPTGGAWLPADGGSVLAPPDARLRRLAARTAALLAATAGRPASFGCFGLHEWAMVYRQEQDEVRHATWPLRLGAEGTSAVVDALPVRCSHIDAFRFFTPAARPLNALQPTRETQVALEQPGCLHATMDLYKWSYRLSPHVPSELVADAFALARRVRELDMRASPYDLSALGLVPVRIETSEGRAQYAAEQRGFADEGALLRARLLDAVRPLAAD